MYLLLHGLTERQVTTTFMITFQLNSNQFSEDPIEIKANSYYAFYITT